MNIHALSAFAMATYCWMLSRVMRGQLGPLPALCISLVAAVGHTSWDLGTRADPLPLALALVALQFLLYREIVILPLSRRLFALCFLAGIGLGAHPAAIAGIPLAIAACRAAGKRPAVAGFYVFLLGLTLFVYLPIRHHRTAYLPEGPAAAFLPTAAQAGTALAGSVRRLPGCFERLVTDHHPLLLVMAIPGLLLLARRHPRLALSLPLLGLAGFLLAGLFPLTARSRYLEVLPLHPLFALSVGYTLTPALSRRHRIWQAAGPLVVAGIALTAMRAAPPRGSRGELAPHVHAMLVQDMIEPGGRLIHQDADLGFRLDHLRLAEARRADITRERTDGTRLPPIPTGETRTYYLDFEPESLPEGYRLEHRGLLFMLLAKETPSPPPFDWDLVPEAFFETGAVRGDPDLEELAAALEAHRIRDRADSGP